MNTTLCQAVRDAHEWKPEEKNAMRRLFEHALKVWPNLVHCLRETQGQLVHNAEQSGYKDWRSIAEFDLELVRLTGSNLYDEALVLTADKLIAAIKQYWPDCPLPSYQRLIKERSERPTGSSTPAAGQVQAP